MTVNCPHKGYKALCPKCHRMSPHGCWEEELNEAISSGSTMQAEIMTELDEVLEAPVEVAKEPNPTLAAPVPAPAPKSPKKAARARKKVSR